jgi:hypothetical protein
MRSAIVPIPRFPDPETSRDRDGFLANPDARYAGSLSSAIPLRGGTTPGHRQWSGRHRVEDRAGDTHRDGGFSNIGIAALAPSN